MTIRSRLSNQIADKCGYHELSRQMHSKSASVDTGSLAPAPSESSKSTDQLTALTRENNSSLNRSGDTSTNETDIDNDLRKASLNASSAEPSVAPTANGVLPEECQGADNDSGKPRQTTFRPTTLAIL